MMKMTMSKLKRNESLMQASTIESDQSPGLAVMPASSTQEADLHPRGIALQLLHVIVTPPRLAHIIAAAGLPATPPAFLMQGPNIGGVTCSQSSGP